MRAARNRTQRAYLRRGALTAMAMLMVAGTFGIAGVGARNQTNQAKQRRDSAGFGTASAADGDGRDRV